MEKKIHHNQQRSSGHVVHTTRRVYLKNEKGNVYIFDILVKVIRNW